VEERIAEGEKNGRRLQEQLTSPEVYSDKEKFIAVEKEYMENEKSQKLLGKEYEELFEKIMEMESKLNGGTSQ
jgi:ATP-binding cassette subfamily F protein 3